MFARQPLLFQPVEPVTPFTFSEVVEEVRAVFFPEIDGPVEVRIAAEAPLASMRPDFMGRDRHVVTFHPVLNHPETSREVVRFLAKHELTHIVCRGRFLDGWYESHPPEFWDHEHAIAPERYAAWAWIRANLGRCSRHYRLGLAVDRRWRALRGGHRTPYTPSLPFEREQFERLCPEGGAQLRLPPEWTVRPLPAAGGLRLLI
jgi:hypothetical protein